MTMTNRSHLVRIGIQSVSGSMLLWVSGRIISALFLKLRPKNGEDTISVYYQEPDAQASSVIKLAPRR